MSLKFHFDPNVSQQHQALVKGWEQAIEKGYGAAAGQNPIAVSVLVDGKGRETIRLIIHDPFVNEAISPRPVATVDLLPTYTPEHVEQLCYREHARFAQANLVTQGANTTTH